MRKSRKLMWISLLLAVTVTVAVPPTLSWLSSVSAPVVNTFAGGAISIRLDEALVGADGKAIIGEGARRVTSNSYRYVAGATLDKDPTPTVLKGSEKCYVFLCVENNLTDLFTMNYDTVSWQKVAQSDQTAVYVYVSTVDASAASEDMALNPIFTTVQVSPDLTADDIARLGERTVSVTAYAVQAASISSREAIDLAVAQFLPGVVASHDPAVN